MSPCMLCFLSFQINSSLKTCNNKCTHVQSNSCNFITASMAHQDSWRYTIKVLPCMAMTSATVNGATTFCSWKVHDSSPYMQKLHHWKPGYQVVSGDIKHKQMTYMTVHNSSSCWARQWKLPTTLSGTRFVPRETWRQYPRAHVTYAQTMFIMCILYIYTICTYVLYTAPHFQVMTYQSSYAIYQDWHPAHEPLIKLWLIWTRLVMVSWSAVMAVGHMHLQGMCLMQSLFKCACL